jgi:hypothetical protein
MTRVPDWRNYRTRHLIAIFASLLWIASAWLPIAWTGDGEAITFYQTRGMSVNLVLGVRDATFYWIVGYGIITLLLSLFHLRFVCFWAFPLWVFWMNLPGRYAAEGYDGPAKPILLVAILLIWAASVVERRKRESWRSIRCGGAESNLRRYYSPPRIFALVGAICGCISPWFPIGFFEEGYALTAMNAGVIGGANLHWPGVGEISSGYYLLTAAIVALLLVLFDLPSAALWIMIMWMVSATFIGDVSSWIPEPGGWGSRLRMISIVLIFTGSMWERWRLRGISRKPTDAASAEAAPT